MSKLITTHLNFISATNLEAFQKEAFSVFASYNVKGVNAQLGVMGDDTYAVVIKSFKNSDCIQKFNKPQDAINRYKSYLEE